MVRTLRKEGLNQQTFGQNGATTPEQNCFFQSNSYNLLSISIFPCWNLQSKKGKHIFNYALSVSGNVLCIGSDLDSHPCLNPSLFSALSWKSGSFFLNIVFEAEFFVHLSFQSQSSSQSSTKVVVLNRMECCVGQRQQQNWIPTSLANSWFLDESTKDFAANNLVTPSGVWWLPP